jgi:hypothetical protein
MDDEQERTVTALLFDDRSTVDAGAARPQGEHPTSPLPDRRWLGLSTASTSLRDERAAARVLTVTPITSRRLTAHRPAVERVAGARR